MTTLFMGSPVRRRIRSILLAVGCYFAATFPAFAWFSFTLPPGYVNPQSTKRNHIFYVGEQVRFTLSKAVARYEVRDYYGRLVDQAVLSGASAQQVQPRVSEPGWYKLYIYGNIDQGEPWGYIVGGTHFVIFRNDPKFPVVPPISTSNGSHPALDLPSRGLTGMGPQRHAVDDASKPDEAIAKLVTDLALDKAFYLPFDPLRKRELLVSFPNGVGNDPAKIAGVKKIVERFKGDVKYWEGKNEPDQGRSALHAVEFEQNPFYAAVKSVDPSLKVLGPGVTTSKLTTWIDTFLTNARTKIDVFSFHAYNCVNGDLWLARQTLTDLQSLLKKHGLENIEKWQTEQGYFAAVYGSYQPRLQGRWTMIQMMVYEQFGIPKEHNHYWYDKSHGFWNFPTFFVNSDGSLNPAASLLRVWSEQLYGTTFSRAFSFGPAEDPRMIGSLFTGPDKSVAAFMTAGDPYGSVTLSVTSGSSIEVVSPFGVVSTLPVTNGTVVLPVSELPVYVNLAAGQTCNVVPRAYGENLARRPGVTFATNGNLDVGAAKLANGVLENWYYAQSAASAPWAVTPTQWPVTLDINLPTAESVSSVVIHAAVPWQNDSTLLDYDLQYFSNGAWHTITRVTEPTKTFKVYSPPSRCSVDSFFSDRYVFQHAFAPVTTSKFRLLIRDVTYGGGATAEVFAAGGQAGPRRVVLREIEVYKALPEHGEAPHNVQIKVTR